MSSEFSIIYKEELFELYVKLDMDIFKFIDSIKTLYNIYYGRQKRDYCEKVLKDWAVDHYSEAFRIIRSIKLSLVDAEVVEQMLVLWAYHKFMKHSSNRPGYEQWLKDHNLFEGKKYKYAGMYYGFWK